MASGKAYWLAEQGAWGVQPDKTEPLERIADINDGSLTGIPIHYELVDPRAVSPKQRALFWALMNDIYNWSGEPVEFLKDWFYTRYTVRTMGKTISLSNAGGCSMSDANVLLDDVVDFIFEFGVPLKAGYELLPRSEQHFQYNCVKHRQCVICGRRADIHHVDEIGMGRNRNHINHTQYRLAALCRVHHTESHQIGLELFCDKYRLTSLGVKVDAETLKKLGITGNYYDKQDNDLHGYGETINQSTPTWN